MYSDDEGGRVRRRVKRRSDKRGVSNSPEPNLNLDYYMGSHINSPIRTISYTPRAKLDQQMLDDCSAFLQDLKIYRAKLETYQTKKDKPYNASEYNNILNEIEIHKNNYRIFFNRAKLLGVQNIDLTDKLTHYDEKTHERLEKSFMQKDKNIKILERTYAIQDANRTKLYKDFAILSVLGIGIPLLIINGLVHGIQKLIYVIKKRTEENRHQDIVKEVKNQNKLMSRTHYSHILFKCNKKMHELVPHIEKLKESINSEEEPEDEAETPLHLPFIPSTDSTLLYFFSTTKNSIYRFFSNLSAPSDLDLAEGSRVRKAFSQK